LSLLVVLGASWLAVEALLSPGGVGRCDHRGQRQTGLGPIGILRDETHLYPRL
jgi:hypothetical protein